MIPPLKDSKNPSVQMRPWKTVYKERFNIEKTGDVVQSRVTAFVLTWTLYYALRFNLDFYSQAHMTTP